MVSLFSRIWKHKMLFIMRLTFSIILFCVLQSFAIETLSQNQRLSINQKNVRIEDIIQLIENKTDYYFMYSVKAVDVEKTINIEATDKLVPEILDVIFKGTNVSYKIDGRLIALSKNGGESAVGQQSRSVSGKVTDSSGSPLPGASVVLKGTTTGVITDSNGKYSISNLSANAILQFSFVGMKMQTIEVGSKSNINIMLENETIGLDEVVAIGYGTKSKATVTGAVEIVTDRQFLSKPQSNVSQSLQGAVPGLMVTRSSGRVGEESSLQIRGITSRAGTGVLVIIDGIPQPENNAVALNKLNPQDIESISILKDAQASIYGARAAGGVILVTTKSGKSNKPVVNYSANFALNVPAIWAKRANIYDQADYYIRAFENDGVTQNPYSYLKDLLPTLDPKKPQIIPGPFSDTPKMSSGYYDWMDIMFDPALQQTHQVSVSGKSEKSNYYVSVGVLDQPGMMAYGSNSNKRYFSRLKYKFDINDKLSFSTNISLERQKVLEPAKYDLAVAFASSVWSTHFPYTTKGNYFNFGGFQNPIGNAEAGGEREGDANRATAQFTFNYKPVKGLEITGDYSMNTDNNSGSVYNKIIQFYNYDDVPVAKVEPNSAGSSFSRNMQKVANLYANYKYSIQNHNFGLMAGSAHEENDFKYFSASRDKLISEAVPILTMGDLALQNTSESRNQWALQSYFSRFNYDFMGKYLFEGTLRRDGSSRFAKDYRWGNYLGGSGAWVASEESFIKNLRLVDFLKFRMSYGELGNQNNVGLYDHISIINIASSTLLFGNPDSPTKTLIAAASGVLPSPSRTWETVATQNLGVDFRLLNSKLKGSFDYFIKNTKDMLVTKEFPEILGIAPSTVNGGELRTNGWEFSLNWSSKLKNDFNYFVNFNIFDNQSKVTSLEDSRVPKFGLNNFVEGQPYNSYYTLVFDGFIRNEAELNDYKKITGVPSSLRVGDARFKDLDGDGKIEYSEYKKGDPNSGDIKNIGNTNIRFQYGFTAGFDWKGIDFSAFFQGVGKWNVMSGIKQPGSNWWEAPLQLTMGKDWTEQNPNALYPKASADGGIDSWNYQNSDAPYRWYTTRYIRLKNVQVGYTLPSTLYNKVGLSKVRVYFSGSDLWEKTNMPKGLDPERPYDAVYWVGFTPFPRTYSFGIDVTL